jgi:hypothetical protein
LNLERFLHWLGQIYATTDSEPDCEQFHAILPAYVEIELAGDDPAERYPGMRAHLAQCPDCAEEHRGLRAILELEAQGRLPQVDESLAQFEEAEPAHDEGVPVGD